MSEKSMQSLGDAPIDDAYREQMRALAVELDKYWNGDAKGAARKVGYVLMVFPFRLEPGRCNYISNANRADVTVLLREQLARFEGMPEMKGTA